MTPVEVYNLFGTGLGVGLLLGAFVALVNAWLPGR